jgi:hypothetical protein
MIIYKESCVDGIYSNLSYTRNRMLNTRMKKKKCNWLLFEKEVQILGNS